MPIKRGNEKKTALLAHKEKLLQDIKYYEKRIEDFCSKTSSNTYFANSSDSEDDFPTAINNEPSVSQLKIKQSELRTCLQATQELTNLQVLQSEVNVMVEDPVLEGEPPVNGPGSWREVAAECRIDLVPFSIMFYVHQPDGLFAPKSYRGLKVLPVKTAHEIELARSVLTKVKHPSDAIEVLRRYAAAYRSRRTTLARLADKYANDLFMEPMAEGGYVMKCVNLLELSWRLENKWSRVAAFQHKMKFDLEYMDESYIKIIAQAHKQLCDPSIETDERTLLLAKIISTCLEAQGPTQELYESMESDPESVRKLEKRRTTLDQDTEAPIPKKKRDGQSKDARESEIAKDDQIMAPPKSLPKKTKPKGKENVEQNRKSVKRSNVEESTSNVKKAKTNTNDVRESGSDLNEAENTKNQPKNDKHTKNEAKIANTDKSKSKPSLSKINTEKERVKSAEITKEPKKSSNVEVTSTANKPQNQNTEKSKKQQGQAKNPNEEEKSKKKEANKINGGQKVGSKDKMAVSAKNDPKTKELNDEEAPNKDKNAASSKNCPKNKETKAKKVTSVNKNEANSKNDLKSKAVAEKLPNKNKTAKNDQIAKETGKLPSNDKNVASSKNDPNSDGNTEKLRTNDKNVASSKNDPNRDDNKPKENAVKTKNALTQKPVPPNNQIQKEKPETNKKTEKKSSIDNKKVKTTKNQEAVKNTDGKNKTSKKDTNPKTLNKNKTDALNPNNKANAKEPNVQNTKKNINKEINLNKNPTNTDIAISNTDNLPKNSVNNKLVVANVKKATNIKKRPEFTEKDDPKNIASRTDNHIAITKPTLKNKDITKFRNKIAIKSLSNKNPAQNKLLKNGETGNINNVTSNTAKNFNHGNEESGSATKISKIPQKKFFSVSPRSFKNPLRISPRTFSSTFKSASDSNIKQKNLQKGVTNIPRLVKKPETKLK